MWLDEFGSKLLNYNLDFIDLRKIEQFCCDSSSVIIVGKIKNYVSHESQKAQNEVKKYFV